MRRLREEAGFSLEDIMAETKVSRRVLEALEAGRFERLPERVFCRNFVLQYARSIGADETHMVDAFNGAWDRYQLASGSHPVLLVDEPPPAAPLRLHFWIPMGLAAVILVVVIVVLVRGPRPDDSMIPRQRDAGASMRRGTPVPPGTPGPPLATPAHAVPDEASASAEFVRFGVRVAEQNECWIHLRDRNGRTEQRLLSGPREVPFELEGPVLLTLGNAAAAILVVNGREYGGLGSAGQVVHLQVTSAGLEPLGAEPQRE